MCGLKKIFLGHILHDFVVSFNFKKESFYHLRPFNCMMSSHLLSQLIYSPPSPIVSIEKMYLFLDFKSIYLPLNPTVASYEEIHHAK